MSLAVVHAKYQLLESIRIPIVPISITAFPSLALLFFVVPFGAVTSSQLASNEATAQMLFFSVMCTALFTFSQQVSDDRVRPWGTYLRSLPVTPLQRLGGTVMAVLPLAAMGLIPLVIVAYLFTAFEVSVLGALAGLGALLVGVTPFVVGSFAMGQLLSPKAAIAVAQVLMFVLAFAGGLFIPPANFPSWLGAISQGLPSRSGRDLLVSAINHTPLSLTALAVTVAWTLALAALALWAYRRDEGRRFS